MKSDAHTSMFSFYPEVFILQYVLSTSGGSKLHARMRQQTTRALPWILARPSAARAFGYDIRRALRE